MTYINRGFSEGESDKPQLAFGYNGAFKLVPRPLAAWGQRAIITDGGEHLDMVPDRRSITYTEEKHWKRLAALLDGGVLDAMCDHFALIVREGEVRWDEAYEVVLYDDDSVLVVGNSNASYGYFYITALLKPMES